MAYRKILAVDLVSTFYIHSGQSAYNSFIHRYNAGDKPSTSQVKQTCRCYDYLNSRNVSRIRRLQDALQKLGTKG